MLAIRLLMCASLLVSGPAEGEPEPAPTEWPDDLESDPSGPSESATGGCTKDTDCKGERICDAATARCIDPTTATTATPSEPQPLVRRDHSPPLHRPGPPVMHRPYAAGGAVMIGLGLVGAAVGGIWLGVYTSKVKTATLDASNALPWENADKANRLAELSARGPKVQAGTAILISSGAVMLVAGIILASIERPVRRASLGPLGLTLRF